VKEDITMVRILIAIVSAVVLAGSVVAGAAAAPKEGKSHQTESIDCGDFGEFEVLTSENGATGFGPGGEVFVAKRFAFDMMITVTTFDDEVFGPFPDSFSEGAKGKGFEGRLIECSLPGSFAETFILDEGAAEFFGIPAEYVGTEVTFEGNGTGTVWIIDPGK
jgi:hypothetical protein